MTALFQLVLYGVDAARTSFGALGVLTSGAILGLADVDALTVTMARGAADSAGLGVGADAIAVGVLANSLLKLAIALAVGAPGFRRIGGAGLALIAVAVALPLLW